MKRPPDEATPLVQDYLVKKMLSQIGYKFDGEKVSDFEVQYLTTVAATLNELEEKDLKKRSKKASRKR